MHLHTVPALRGKDYGKSKMKYPDYVETASGLQYKVMQHVVKCKCFSVKKTLFLTSSINKLQDLRPGNGPKPKKGETVVVRH